MKQPQPPLYVCLRLPEFAAQALLRLRPAMRSQPAAVLEGTPPLERVCAVNAAARLLGVEHGLSRAELDSFPPLQILRRSLVEEESARAALLEVIESFTPRCQDLRLSQLFNHLTSPDNSALVLALDMTGTGRVIGPPLQAAHKLRRAARSLGLSARVVGSANLHAAVCIARLPHQAVQIVTPGSECELLATLPIHVLAPHREEAEALSLWGIRTVGELARLPEKDVAARLGEEGRRLLRLACGEHPHLLVAEEAAFTLCERVEFDSPVDNLDSLLFVLGPMLRQLMVRAGYRALALASATVVLELEGAPDHTRMVKPALPVFDRELLLKLIHLDLQAHPPGAGVLTVQLSAEPGPRPDVQTGLFSPQLPESARLDVTLARIAALVGEGRVGRAALTDTHAPDAFHMERFIAAESASPQKGSHPRKQQTPEQDPGPRTGIALRRLRPPAPIVAQCVGTDPPCAFYWDRMRYVIRRTFGPWRRSGDWWTAGIWSREEWDVEATSVEGSRILCLLVHDLLRRTWHMEALYD